MDSNSANVHIEAIAWAELELENAHEKYNAAALQYGYLAQAAEQAIRDLDAARQKLREHGENKVTVPELQEANKTLRRAKRALLSQDAVLSKFQREIDLAHRKLIEARRDFEAWRRAQEPQKQSMKPSMPKGSKSGHQQSHGDRPKSQKECATRTPPEAEHKAWLLAIDAAFANLKTMDTFPAPPAWTCGSLACETTDRAISACPCNLRVIFKGVADLKHERLRWHPDKFSICPEGCRESHQRKAKEVFVVVDSLYRNGQK